MAYIGLRKPIVYAMDTENAGKCRECMGDCSS